MDLKSLLNQALNSDLVKQGGQTLSQGAQSLGQGAQKLGQDKSQLATLGAGAVGGGLIGLLMGSKKTRKMGKKVAGIGGAAALGALAFKVYGDWQKKQPDHSVASTPTDTTPQLTEDQHSTLILKAMIAAAKADGHVDEQEQQKIQQAVESMGAGELVNQLVTSELNKPLDPSELARNAATPEQAAEIYLASLLVADEQNFMEKAYLKELASQLGLADDLVAQLEQQVKE
ncbi:tellurite resistance TerB family protein [Vibrio tapetis subsp. quintayensis]|uniref:tellurite resistance TerB family protein n=1 Tax=Vibrio tapetis TaxID=52443 RepID=UPI0025B40027|nr:tellurite resistance TerB family protein [Vibrio tapetis]MDN3681369.1 tellurite resistance TerB family protein [Vibrio tapetis subsp. quintayensis]